MDRFSAFTDDAGAALAALTDDPQDTRLLRLEFPRGDGPAGVTLLPNKLQACEELSRDFRFEVEVLSDDAHVALKAVLGKMVTVSLVREDATLRYFNGYVFEFRLIGTDGGFARYQMVLGPWLAFTRLHKDCVSYHGWTLTEMADRVFMHYRQRDWRTRLAMAYPPLTCANQYNETDHNHLHRRWEDAGLSYWYEHRLDGHTMWLGDDTTQAEKIDAGVNPLKEDEIPFRAAAGSAEDDGIYDWQPVRRMGAGSATLGSYNFKYPGAPQPAARESLAKQGDVPSFEVFEDTGAYGYKNLDDGEVQAQRRMEEIDAMKQYFEARSNDRCVQPGRTFTLGEHFSAAPKAAAARAETPAAGIGEREYLIIAATHTATNNYQAGKGAKSHYDNAFACMRKNIPWRPGRGYHSIAPNMTGVQTAVVVGPPGEEIYTDEFGCVKVQFHWDRLGEDNEKSSAWVRVMTSWAGDRFGQIALPRVGQEVVIQFLNGNVDRPIIIGSVFNSNNMPPWPLPDNRTQSGMLTRSTKGGQDEHANALRFEDSRGREQLWLHAERDQLTEVEHDEVKWVGNDRKKTIDRDEVTEVRRDRTETVGHDEKVTVHNNRTERVDKDETIAIGGNRSGHVGKNETVRIDGMKTELVMLAKSESVGLAKALSIGGAYAITVGAVMNTLVTLSQFGEVLVNKVVKVGKNFDINAGDAFEVTVGKSRLRMEKDGTVVLSGIKITIDASGPVQINGNDVDVN